MPSHHSTKMAFTLTGSASSPANQSTKSIRSYSKACATSRSSTKWKTTGTDTPSAGDAVQSWSSGSSMSGSSAWTKSDMP